MPNPGCTDACAPVHGWETVALANDGGRKRVKDPEELTKMTDTDTS